MFKPVETSVLPEITYAMFSNEHIQIIELQVFLTFWEPSQLFINKNHKSDNIRKDDLSTRANTSVFKDGDFNLGDRKLRKIANAKCISSYRINILAITNCFSKGDVLIYYSNFLLISVAAGETVFWWGAYLQVSLSCSPPHITTCTSQSTILMHHSTLND